MRSCCYYLWAISDVCASDKRRRFFRSSACRQWTVLVVVDATNSVSDGRDERTGQSLGSAFWDWEMASTLLKFFLVRHRVCTNAILDAFRSVDYDLCRVCICVPWKIMSSKMKAVGRPSTLTSGICLSTQVCAHLLRRKS